MTPVQLLTYLKLMGVEISAGENFKLNATGPEQVLTETMVAQLRTYKHALLEMLSKDAFDASEVKEALQFVCHGLAVTPETLIREYFTPDDLFDIRKGRYPDLVALRKLILSDPGYPFNGKHQQGGRCE